MRDEIFRGDVPADGAAIDLTPDADLPLPSDLIGSGPVEGVTLALILGTYALWGAALFLLAPLGPWYAVPLLAVLTALH